MRRVRAAKADESPQAPLPRPLRILRLLVVTIAIAALFHRRFVAFAFDSRVAHTLRLRPRLASAVLVGLVTLAVVASYGAVGSLLVVGLLLAPAVTAGHWAKRIPTTMLLAAMFGVVAVYLGLLASWHLETAAGASIAATSIGIALLSALVHQLMKVSRATS